MDSGKQSKILTRKVSNVFITCIYQIISVTRSNPHTVSSSALLNVGKTKNQRGLKLIKSIFKEEHIGFMYLWIYGRS